MRGMGDSVLYHCCGILGSPCMWFCFCFAFLGWWCQVLLSYSSVAVGWPGFGNNVCIFSSSLFFFFFCPSGSWDGGRQMTGHVAKKQFGSVRMVVTVKGRICFAVSEQFTILMMVISPGLSTLFLFCLLSLVSSGLYWFSTSHTLSLSFLFSSAVLRICAVQYVPYRALPKPKKQ
jgi:hypothetical protein